MIATLLQKLYSNQAYNGIGQCTAFVHPAWLRQQWIAWIQNLKLSCSVKIRQLWYEWIQELFLSDLLTYDRK